MKNLSFAKHLFALIIFSALVFGSSVAPAMAKPSTTKPASRDRYSHVKLKFSVGDQLPDFPLKTLNGSQTNLNSVLKKGRNGTVMVVWATWCGACARVMPYLEKHRAQLAQNSVEMVGVNLDLEKNSPIRQFIQEKSIGFDVMIGDAKAANSIFANREIAVPLVIFLNEKGFIKNMTFGWSAELLNSVESLAARKTSAK